jgi:hypothetical protein
MRITRVGVLARFLAGLVPILALALTPALAAASAEPATPFPPPLDSYGDSHLTSVWQVLVHRVDQHPFNLVATLFFLAAIVHTAMTHRFRQIAHDLQEKHQASLRAAEAAGQAGSLRRVCGTARVFDFLGEVEVVFGIWIVPLVVAVNLGVGHVQAVDYIDNRVSFTEPIFVVVVMTIASTRPVLRLAEQGLGWLARLGGGTPAAWWLSILTAGTVLGSFITEPGAMTICALLLSRKFYSHRPGPRLAYATLGLLFVSISTGGTLTHFAAPPVLMVAGPWGWTTKFMLVHFGWKALTGIVLSAGVYFLLLRKDLLRLVAAM